jgi:hypothetical protein
LDIPAEPTYKNFKVRPLSVAGNPAFGGQNKFNYFKGGETPSLK